MKAAGVNVVKHYKDLAFMGFVEVLKNLPTIFKNLSFSKSDIISFDPEVVILIDFPGFNLQLVKWAKEKGLKVIFYISPQLWAWNERRVHHIKKYVKKMIVILPFEKDFYKKFGYDVEYVGHPLVEVIEQYQIENATNQKDENIVALLPGSRKQEIKRKLPVMLATASNFADYNFIVAKAPGINDEFYSTFLSSYKNVTAVADQTYSILMRSKAALVTSGTATLETALFNVPEIVCYKANKVSYEIAKRVIKLKYISLVNIIMNKQVVKELIQDDLTVEKCTLELKQLLTNESLQQQIKDDYKALKDLLSAGGNASANAATVVFNYALNGETS